MLAGILLLVVMCGIDMMFRIMVVLGACKLIVHLMQSGRGQLHQNRHDGGDERGCCQRPATMQG